MEERLPIASEQMSQEDWEHMRASGKQLVEELLKRVMQLEAELRQLRTENQLLRELNQPDVGQFLTAALTRPAERV